MIGNLDKVLVIMLMQHQINIKSTIKCLHTSINNYLELFHRSSP